MRKLVVAGLVGLVAFSGWQSTALSQPLMRAFIAPIQQDAGQPVILAQAAADAVRIQLSNLPSCITCACAFKSSGVARSLCWLNGGFIIT